MIIAVNELYNYYIVTRKWVSQVLNTGISRELVAFVTLPF